MVRINPELKRAYDNAKAGRCGPDAKKIADASDRAAGAVMYAFKYDDVPFPGDDRMMLIELHIFDIALKSEGFDFRNLAFEVPA